MTGLVPGVGARGTAWDFQSSLTYQDPGSPPGSLFLLGFEGTAPLREVLGDSSTLGRVVYKPIIDRINVGGDFICNTNYAGRARSCN